MYFLCCILAQSSPEFSTCGAPVACILRPTSPHTVKHVHALLSLCVRWRGLWELFWKLEAFQYVHLNLRRHISAGVVQGSLSVVLSSAHGMECPLPMVDRIQWAFLQPCRAASLAPGDVVQGCKLEEHNALEHEEGAGGQLSRGGAPEEHETAKSCLKEEAQVAVGAAHVENRIANGSSSGQCSGEVAVEGSEGPFTFAVDLNSWPSTEAVRGQISLCLQLTFGCGADACLRNQNFVLDIDVDKVPCMALTSSAAKMWGAAESCQATFEIKTQVRALQELPHPPFQFYRLVQPAR